MPNKLLQKVYQQINPGSFILDLGCGTGRDAIFLDKYGFKVVAVDKSAEYIETLKNIQNIEAICADIINFNIAKDKYAAIQMHNCLQFVDRERGMQIIQTAKNNLKNNGFIIISCFRDDDPIAVLRPKSLFFKSDELKHLFADFDILHYQEIKIDDAPHRGYEVPHQHSMMELIAKKI